MIRNTMIWRKLIWGKTFSLFVAALAVAIGSTAFAQLPETKQSEQSAFEDELHPTAKEVIEKYIKAIGGRERLGTKRNLKIEFKTNYVCNGVKLEYKTVLFVSGFLHVHVDEKNRKKWYLDPKSQPYSEFGKGQLTRRLPVDYRHPSAWPLFIANYPGKLTFDKTKSLSSGDYVLRAEPIFDKPTPRHVNQSPKSFIFDKKSGLLKTMMKADFTYQFRDYQKTGGLMVPHEIEVDIKIADIVANYVEKISTFQLDAKIPKDLFVVPEEYRLGKGK